MKSWWRKEFRKDGNSYKDQVTRWENYSEKGRLPLWRYVGAVAYEKGAEISLQQSGNIQKQFRQTLNYKDKE